MQYSKRSAESKLNFNIMKKIFFILCSLLAVVTAGAQTSHVATLSHDGEITTFYSSNALVSALAQATDGDIITLSSGTFTSPTDITKNVTIRGAGMILEESPTILTGVINIKTPASETNKSLIMEGLYFNSKVYMCNAQNPQFIKCWFNDQVLDSSVASYKFYNYLFLHCVCNNGIDLRSSSKYSGTINNCLITIPYLANCEIKNTTIINGNSLYYNYSSLINCVIESKNSSTSTYIPESSVAVNCTYIGNSGMYFKYQASETNKIFPAATPVFKEDTFYELLDELKTTWLGNDGTQRGMYGGSWPFDPTTTNPRITKFNVAKKTTADGKLPVEIEVEAN